MISKGLYVENLIINKPGLTLESMNNEGDVIIVASMRPTLTVDLQKGDTLTLSGLKLTHCGNNEESYANIYSVLKRLKRKTKLIISLIK